MNPNIIREEVKKHLNQNVLIKVYKMRGKTYEYNGTIKAIYPNIFTILDRDGEKSFSYRDIITGEIKIKYP